MRSFFVALLVAFSYATVFAQSASTTTTTVAVPRLIRFNGQVPGASGTVGITFSLHTTQHDNHALWIETQNVPLDANGKYTVLLGATAADGVPMDAFTSGAAQWLAIRVENHAEQRVLLVSVPYALKAAEAETLAGHAAGEFVTSDNLTTAVQQQLRTSGTSGQKSSTDPKSTAVPTNTATNFTDNNATQVVAITQNGTGIALKAASPGTAIVSQSFATSGAARAVDARVASPGGVAVYGTNNATSGAAVGVQGHSNSPAGSAVYGNNTATTGASIGVRASVASPAGIAGVFQNTSTGFLLSGRSGASLTEVFSVGNAGHVSAKGGVETTNVSASGFGSFGAKVQGATVNASSVTIRQPFTVNGTGVFGVGSVFDNNVFAGVGAGSSNKPAYGKSNVFVGGQAGHANTVGYSNLFAGYNSGTSNTTGYFNIFLGEKSGQVNIDGHSNVFIGPYAGYSNTSGSGNVAIGGSAGYFLTTGSGNIYLGSSGCSNPCTENNTIRIGDGSYGYTGTYIAGIRNQDMLVGSPVYISDDGELGVGPAIISVGSSINNENTFVGNGAGANNSSATLNTFLGSGTGYKTTTGGFNTYLGAQAGDNDVTGSGNTIIGALAGANNTSGYNVFVGMEAGYNNTTGGDNIYVGNMGCTSPCTESKTIRIGNDQTATFIAGINGTSLASGSIVYVDSNGQLGIIPPPGTPSLSAGGLLLGSSVEAKQVTSLEDTSKLFELRTVQVSAPPNSQFGLVAQEVAKVFPELVTYDEQGQASDVKYAVLPVMLLDALQKEHARAVLQEKKIADLEERLARLEAATAK